MATDIGVQAAKTGMLASAIIIETVAGAGAIWAGRHRAVRRRPGVCLHARRPAAAPPALDTLRTELFPLASLVTPNLDEVRLLVGIDVVDDATQRDAAKALHALGPKWALVKGGHLRGAEHSPDLLYDGTEFHEYDAPRIDTARPRRRRHPGRGHRVRAGPRLSDARRRAFGKGWVTERLKSAYPLGGGTARCRRLFGCRRPSPGIRTDIAGVAHASRGHPRPAWVMPHPRCRRQPRPPLLIRICDEWAHRGWLAVLPQPAYRRRPPEGPLSGSATADRAGVLEAIEVVRGWTGRTGDRRWALLRRQT